MHAPSLLTIASLPSFACNYYEVNNYCLQSIYYIFLNTIAKASPNFASFLVVGVHVGIVSCT